MDDLLPLRQLLEGLRDYWFPYLNAFLDNSIDNSNPIHRLEATQVVIDIAHQGSSIAQLLHDGAADDFSNLPDAEHFLGECSKYCEELIERARKQEALRIR